MPKNYAVTESQNGTRLTGSATVSAGPGSMLGIFVAAASGTPTITVRDGANTLVGTYTPTSATFYAHPFTFKTSLIITISGTVDCTVGWSK